MTKKATLAVILSATLIAGPVFANSLGSLQFPTLSYPAPTQSSGK